MLEIRSLRTATTLTALALLSGAAASSCAGERAKEPSFRQIFNGKDLTGWEGNPALWSVEDGAITGTTSNDDPLPYNQFLIWRGDTPRDFELRMSVRLEGENNSGIQYRSRQLPSDGEFVVGGYQVDIHPRTEYNGMLYEEKGRGIIAQQGQKVVIDEIGDKWAVGSTGPLIEVPLNDWNEYSVIATGNRLVHKLNGTTTVEVIDHQASLRSLEGILALQVHRGPPMRVQFKDIRLRELPEGRFMEPEETPIPEGAEKLP